ncbi:MAG: S-adenosylmethionine:tRNA ribosyltransferase-isomerase [Bacteroidetes bacterium]|nr:S-adenosylmethionine:tRNA ribosyltransferase-isomerase [Bacteroidota bacterium]
MTGPQRLKVQDFSYVLPEHRIAKFPLTDRSSSLLLVYKSGIIRKTVFKNIAEVLPGEFFAGF